MNFRRIAKPVAALLLAVGLVTAGVAAPAEAGPTRTASDTGWGRK